MFRGSVPFRRLWRDRVAAGGDGRHRRSRFDRRLVALLALAPGLALGLGSSVAHAGATLNVCGSCTYTTMQAAIDAASSGDTIAVSAGTYSESVTVDKNLTLKGAQAGLAGASHSGPESVVTSINIANANAVIDGFDIVPGTNNSGTGLIFTGTTGANAVINNVITGYDSSATFWATGTGTFDFSSNLVADSTGTLTDGLQVQNGVTASANMTVENNVFDHASVGGADIQLSFGSATGTVVSGNTSTGGATLVTLFNSTGAQVTNNTFTGDQSYSGSIAYVGGGNSSTTISGNTFSGSSGGAVSVANAFGYGVNTGTTITGNTLTGSVRGISISAGSIDDAETVVAHDNRITNNTLAARNLSGGSLDLTRNWLGTAVGTTVASLISGSNVTYSPYYVDAGFAHLSSDVPTSVYVDSAYTDGSADSHSFGWDAFATIQQSVNAVAAAGTVNLASGAYHESVAITKPLALTGTGATPADTTIAGDGSSLFIVKVNGADGVTLSNLTIDGGGSAPNANTYRSGILLSGSGTAANPVEIRNATIKDIWAGTNDTGGIEVDGASYALIHGVTIQSFFKNGVRFVLSGGKLYDSEIVGHDVDGITAVQNLVNLRSGSNVEIYGNKLHNAHTLTGSSATWDSVGVLVSAYNAGTNEQASQASIHDNEIYFSDSAVVVGSAYTGGQTDGTDHSSATIANNNLHDLTTGINFEQSSAGATITGNTFASIAAIALDAEAFGTALTSSPSVTASGNWWGQASGPAGGQIAGSVSGTARPWCTTSSCSTLSDNADLTALSVSAGSLSFSGGTTSYRLDVGGGTSSTSVSATATPGASVSVSGGGSLAVGANTITVSVTSADGSVHKTYTVTVTRAVPASTGGGGTTTTAQTATTPAAPVVNAPVSAPAGPGVSGTIEVAVAPPTPTGGPTVGVAAVPVRVGVAWAPEAFAVPVTVLVTPAPAASTSTATPGGATTPAAPVPVAGGFTVGATTVQLTVTDSAGVAVHQFAAPLVIHVSASAAGAVPAYSQDGTSWTTIPRLASPSLPDGQQDGYFRNADGSIDIYTRHATFFGLLQDAQAPTAPKLRASIDRHGLRLSWSGAKDNVRVSGYRISLGGKALKTTARTVVVLPVRVGRYTVVALDAAGNHSRASTGVRVVHTKNTKHPYRTTS